MACFVVTATEAVVSTIITKAVISKEKKAAESNTSVNPSLKVKTPFSKKLKWLNTMLWGGSALLLLEHIWSGEVVPYFPFLTGAMNAEDTAEMLHEMATSGVGMALLVTAVWGIIVAVTYAIEKKAIKEAKD